MISKTKFKIEIIEVAELFKNAGIRNAENITPLTAGEYNSVFSAAADGLEYVIKIAPQNNVPVLTYEKDLMRQETRFLTVMKEAEMRVPEIYFSDFSRKNFPTDYFIMEKLKGKNLAEASPSLSADDKQKIAKKLAETAAKLHTVKYSDLFKSERNQALKTNSNDETPRFGYLQNGLYSDWYSAIRSMTKNLIFDCEQKRKRIKKGEKLLDCIEKHKKILQKVPSALVNFDLWNLNIFPERTKDGFELALIDPERSFFGDPIADFVCLEPMTFAPEKKTLSISAYNAYSEELYNERHINKSRSNDANQSFPTFGNAAYSQKLYNEHYINKPLSNAENAYPCPPVTFDAEQKIRYYIAAGYLGFIMATEKFYRYKLTQAKYYINAAASNLYLDTALKNL
ncbi:MAG: aminoglycoside phosphotransferase family protein [Clostridiales bacterium]|jgi:aminoglycoside phosphotransferase (APT) family kinase protein|nr:aminoglycoside phosphotransferase family protein [Clostridiales bacterium]